MNKFAKNMAAIAVSALIAGPAAAVEIQESYEGENAKVTLSGGGCKNKSSGKSDILTNVFGDGFGFDNAPSGDEDDNAGPNTGLWQGFITVQQGIELDGEGILVISKRGKDKVPKNAAFGMTEDFFTSLVVTMSSYVFGDLSGSDDECKDADEFLPSTCQIDRNTGNFSKNGENLNMKLDVSCMYETTNGKEKKVKFKYRSGKMSAVDTF